MNRPLAVENTTGTVTKFVLMRTTLPSKPRRSVLEPRQDQAQGLNPVERQYFHGFRVSEVTGAQQTSAQRN